MSPSLRDPTVLKFTYIQTFVSTMSNRFTTAMKSEAQVYVIATVLVRLFGTTSTASQYLLGSCRRTLRMCLVLDSIRLCSIAIYEFDLEKLVVNKLKVALLEALYLMPMYPAWSSLFPLLY